MVKMLQQRRKKKIAAEHRIALRKHLKRKPDMTWAELRQALGRECMLPAIHYVLVDMGSNTKMTLLVTKQDRDDLRKRRQHG